jgi:hypothetical protein
MSEPRFAIAVSSRDFAIDWSTWELLDKSAVLHYTVDGKIGVWMKSADLLARVDGGDPGDENDGE